MTKPFRIVPGSGVTCQEVAASQPICRNHRPLMKKFDLTSYCGCEKSGPPPNECTFDCRLSSIVDESSSPPTSSSGFTPPTMSPSEVSGHHDYPSHFDEILLLDPTLAPSYRSSSSDFDEPSPIDLLSNENSFDEGTIMCSSISTLLPFISDQSFCKDVQDSCCLEITSSTQAAQKGIPLACMMCESGDQILEERILAENFNGKKQECYFLVLCRCIVQFSMWLHTGETCGEISRFFEHLSDERFCEQAIPLHRERCCSEAESTAIIQLEADPATSASIHSAIIPLFMVIVLFAASQMADQKYDDSKEDVPYRSIPAV
jgi:hypothetical protein